ncbi:MAG: DEAD/DEAH box helicase [Peptococcaceae bacterium]|jgi:ATP-dependent DNA helicase DinG|nr:DEAD/DEAH box helicase [Peptococcaceae bacterium]
MGEYLPDAWVFLDLETTGLKPERDRIIEIGLIRREKDRPRRQWEQLINPFVPLDPFITRLTGITNEMAAGGLPLESARGELAAALEGAMLVAHSAAFDVSFLASRLGLRVSQANIIDTIELTKILYPGLSSYSLRSLARYFRLPALPGHRALADALALERLFLALLEKAGRLAPAVLERLVAALGEEKRGVAGLFIALLMKRPPDWLAEQGAGEADERGEEAAAGETDERGEEAAAEQGAGAAVAEAADERGAGAAAGLGEGATAGAADEQGAGAAAAGRGDEAAVAEAAAEPGAGAETLFGGGERREKEKQDQKQDQKAALDFWSKGGMAAALSADSELAKLKTNFQYRPQQLEMQEAVRRAFTESRYLLAEAPTGVGKSLAYLIPAITWATAKGQRVVVATHTIALQEQLYKKEVGLLRRLLPFSFRCAMLKGRGNYLCLDRWQQVLRQGRDLLWGERILLARLALWLAEGGDGDMDSVHLLGPEREWFAQMASSRETCQGTQCPRHKDCFYQKARQQAAGAQLIITNHALLLAGARLGEGVLPKVSYMIVDEAHHLEEEGVRQFTAAFSSQEYERRLQQLHKRRDVFGRPGFLQYLKDFRQQGIASLAVLEPELERLEKSVGENMKLTESLRGVLRNAALPELLRLKSGERRGGALRGAMVLLENLWLAAADLSDSLRRLLALLSGEAGEVFEETWLRLQLQLFRETIDNIELLGRFLRDTAENPAPAGDGGAEPGAETGAAGAGAGPETGAGVGAAVAGSGAGRAGASAGADADSGAAGAGPGAGAGTTAAGADAGAPPAAAPDAGMEPAAWEDSDQCVYWIRHDSRQAEIVLHITPLDLAAYFQKYLFNEKEGVVLTSATLSVKDKFSYYYQQMGIDPDIADAKVFASPFDFKQQVLLLTDKDLPDPGRTAESAYNLALAQSLEILLGACGGQTMVLFTAHRQLRAMYEALHQPAGLLGLELFADGINGNRVTMLEEMRTNPKAVVFGASTFWEGVDLPGLALTSLIIVRLPFAPPGQPLIEAKIESLIAEGKDPFYSYSLPQAVLRFKQGYGRLIRAAEDWGVVVVLDNRIIKKRYGQVFLRSLPAGDCVGAGARELAARIREWRRRFKGTL